MTLTREELDARLDALVANVAQMRGGSSEPLADAIDRASADLLDEAHPGDIEHLWSRLRSIQRDAGLIPGDREPGGNGEAPPDDDAVSQ